MRFLAAIALACFAVAAPARAEVDDNADLAARTIILVNARQKESVELGEFYADQRRIPRENIIALPMPDAEAISWREFVDQIWQPLQDELFGRKWLEGSLSETRDEVGRRRAALTGHRMAYLVTCRGTPLKINHDPALDVATPRRPAGQFQTNRGAVDAQLSLLAQPNQAIAGFVRNPLFNQRHTSSVVEEFVVKVTRLDGPTAADARALVTSALTAEKQGLIGRYYIDLRGLTSGQYAAGDRWLEKTRAQLNDLGYFGDVHAGGATFDPADRFDAPALYFGWYAANVNGPFLRPGFRFPPGAIALHIHSYSANTLRSVTANWCGPLLARGVTATFGNVFEPYLEFTVRPDLLVARLAAGANLADAAFFATPVLGWQSIVIGDPLYRPFKVSLREQLEQLASLPAELAGHVIARQAAVLDQLGMQKEARALFARGMRDFPSLPLALAVARYELLHKRPKQAVDAIRFIGVMKEFSPADWPLARAAAELIAQHGSAREALPAYQSLVRSGAPTNEAQLRALNEARKVADAARDLALSLEFGRMINELTPPPEPVKAGK